MLQGTPGLTTSALISVDAQLQALVTLVEELQEYLQKQRPAFIPPSIYRAAEAASADIPGLRKQISQLEGEWRNLRSLAQISQVVNSSLELDQVLQMVMDTIIQMTGAERGFLMLNHGDSDSMEVRVARNWVQETIPDGELSISKTVINRVLTDGMPVLTTDAMEDPRFGNQDSVVMQHLRSILCVPLMVKRQLTGVIYADNRVRTGLFTKRHLELLTGFANQAGVAIENARLFDSVRATLEQVTGLKNLLNNVFASIPSGVMTIDKHGEILLCNRAAAEIIGQAEADLVGKNLNQYLPQLRSSTDSVFNGGHTLIGMELSGQRQDHPDPQDLRISLSPILDNNQATHGLVIVLEDVTEKHRLEASRSLFSRMVAPAVIDQINPNSLEMGGTRRIITTLFADLRGFTSLSEIIEPEQIMKTLNRYLGIAADIILNEGGTVDKFLGDAVMAWFNAPLPQSDHTLRAVRAALAINAAVAELNKHMAPADRLDFGFGIHVGEAVLGLVGTEKRMEYTAVGDSVNTAKRIQENAIAGQILISKAAYECVANQVKAGKSSSLQMDGKRDPVVVVEIEALK